jgi:hypothetical protein
METPYGPSTFKILDPATSRLIGRVHFTVTLSANGGQTVDSDAHYLNGDYDREEDHLIPAPGGGPLHQVSFTHRFFHRDGSPDRSSQANFLTGAASCTISKNGHPSIHAADFRFSTDTYAGAPVVVPLRDALLARSARVIEFHYFACVPGPRVVSVRATAGTPAPWPFASVPAVKVDLQPDFGWINAIIAPFLPSVAAWFEPSRQWYLAGVESARYYRGPKILLVASPQPPPSGPSEAAKAVPRRPPAPLWPGAESLH